MMIQSFLNHDELSKSTTLTLEMFHQDLKSISSIYQSDQPRLSLAAGASVENFSLFVHPGDVGSHQRT